MMIRRVLRQICPWWKNEPNVAVRWPRSFEQKFRVTKWIVGRG
jgi:hypothetical protein